MAVEMEDVRALLDPEEPDYEAVSALGEDAAPYLDEYAAGLVGGDGATAAVAHAAEHHDPVVRVAAAAAAANLTSPAASDVLETLVVDVDPGVRKVARSSVPEEASEALELRLQELPEESPEGGSEQPDISASRPG
jgi:HEAT repeat protein